MLQERKVIKVKLRLAFSKYKMILFLGFSHWEETHFEANHHVEHGITTESPPQGSDPLPDEPNSCFATTYFESWMKQTVVLGLHEDMIDLMCPFEVRFSFL